MTPKAKSGVVKKNLPNGMTVLFKEDHSSPVVAINMWYRVGSVNETEEQSGLAHFQEHMIFKGTDTRAPGEFANIIKAAGGNLNAATSYSYTMYYVVMPSQQFSLGLEEQADTMMNGTFAQDEFSSELEVVMEEARMYDDTPDSYTFYRTMELGFEKHNYRRPIAGYTEIVQKFTRDQLVEFYKKYYQPKNAILVVVGDVDEARVMSEIERVYGGWAGGPVDVHEPPVEPKQTQFRFKAVKGSTDHVYMGGGFHVPSILHEDYPALEMLGTLLGTGRSSRLYRRVIENEQLATTVSADMFAEKWPGFFMLFASSAPDKWEAARDAVFEELGRFQTELAKEDELEKARRQIEKSLYNNLETVEGQASSMGYYEVLGDYQLAERHRESIRRVTPEQVQYVASKYFRVEQLSLMSYMPESMTAVTPEAADVEASLRALLKPSSNGSRPPASAADVKALSSTKSNATDKPVMSVHTLDNGVKVLVKPRPIVPITSMLTLFGGGTRLEPTGKSGLSTLTARVMLKGAGEYDAEGIVSTVEGLGGRVETYAGFDTAGAYVNVLSEYVDDALPVYRAVMREPKFDADWVEKDKGKLLKELAKRHDHPVHFAIDNLFANVFGKHPYGHSFVGDQDQLAALTATDCRSWYESILTPQNVTVVFVGDIEVDKALSLADELWGDLEGSGVPTPPVEAPAVPSKPGLTELKRANLNQAVGLVGYLAPPMMTPQAIALGVLNGIMTGLGGRLFVELRDKRGFGYMAGSSFSPLKERSLFYCYTNPGPEDIEEAIGVIHSECERVTRELVTDEELSRSKEWLVGSHTMRLQRNLAQATEYGSYEALGFGHDVVERAADMIYAVTKEDILEASKGVFTRDNAVSVKLVPELEASKTD